jgi:hypothetical protein
VKTRSSLKMKDDDAIGVVPFLEVEGPFLVLVIVCQLRWTNVYFSEIYTHVISPHVTM